MANTGLAGILLRTLRARRPSLGWGITTERLPELLSFFALFACLAIPIYLAADLGEVKLAELGLWRSTALAVGFFFIPAFAEELLWRWFLILPQAFGSTRKAAVAVALSTTLFVLAHPLAAWLFVPHAWDYFTQPAFLVIVALLGITCGGSYVMTRSLWPPVLIHWLTVLVWKFLLAGPLVLLGR